MFINRENKPTTCCCGCTLTCGIIVYFIFQVLELASVIVNFNIAGLIGCLFGLAPVVCLYFFNDSWAVRQWNYIWQWILLTGMIIFLLFGFVAATTLISMMCSYAENNSF